MTTKFTLKRDASVDDILENLNNGGESDIDLASNNEDQSSDNNVNQSIELNVEQLIDEANQNANNFNFEIAKEFPIHNIACDYRNVNMEENQRPHMRAKLPAFNKNNPRG